jgi:CRP-like cAMP-binding protein
VLPGALFGSCVCFQLHEYSLSAMCTRDTKLLKIKAATLQRLMDDDHSVGYPLQRMISQTYFKRYVDTMQKLQAIIQTLPLRSG